MVSLHVLCLNVITSFKNGLYFFSSEAMMESLRDAKILTQLLRLLGVPPGKVVFYALMNLRLLVRGLGSKQKYVAEA